MVKRLHTQRPFKMSPIVLNRKKSYSAVGNDPPALQASLHPESHILPDVLLKEISVFGGHLDWHNTEL